MRLRGNVCAALLLCALALAPCAAAQAWAARRAPDARDETVAVRAAFERLVKAFRDRDARAVMALIAEDALLSHAGSRDRDHPALAEVFTKMLAPRPELSETIDPELEEVQVSGNTAFLRITWRTKWSLKDSGKEGSSVNRDLEIWRKQKDGSWKLYRGLECRLPAPVSQGDGKAAGETARP
ncbi:MAG TPA: SgcJ/EcaC family oxidoreductase [Pyrinomonadaceae bacterium]|nr:SgcJ/EcaC family oxidoreductase [Pyrinomonadaceae bacterium]